MGFYLKRLFFWSVTIFGLLIVSSLSAGENGTRKLPVSGQPWFWSLAYINDNYSATWLKGESGNYIGADDFLTASFLMRTGRDDWQATLLYNAVTARRFNYRYDLLTLAFSKKYHWRGLNLTPQAGVVYKGSLSGENIQNGWHKMRGIARVHIPYSAEHGGALLLGATLIKEYPALFSLNDTGLLALETRFASDYIPSRVSPMLQYRIPFINRLLALELTGGWRFYLNSVQEYSDFIRSGYLAAFNLRWRAWRALDVDFGISFTTGRNMLEAEHFGGGSHDVLPQIWLAFGWNLQGSSALDWVNY